MQATFLCPLLYLFLRGVANLKKLRGEGFICSGASLGSIGYASGWEITIKHRWIICWVVYKELMYSSRIDLLFELLSIGSLIFNIHRICWHGWQRKEILDIYSIQWRLRTSQCFTKLASEFLVKEVLYLDRLSLRVELWKRTQKVNDEFGCNSPKYVRMSQSSLE